MDGTSTSRGRSRKPEKEKTDLLLATRQQFPTQEFPTDDGGGELEEEFDNGNVFFNSSNNIESREDFNPDEKDFRLEPDDEEDEEGVVVQSHIDSEEQEEGHPGWEEKEIKDEEVTDVIPTSEDQPPTQQSESSTEPMNHVSSESQPLSQEQVEQLFHKYDTDNSPSNNEIVNANPNPDPDPTPTPTETQS